MAGDTLMQYNVQDPQGNNRVIEGPDGASDEEIISQAQKMFGQSGAMPTQSPMAAFKAALANHPARPQLGLNPDQGASISPTGAGNGFAQDVSTGNAVEPTEQRVLNNMNTVAAGYGTGQLAAGIGAWGAGKIGSLMDTMNTAKGAEALAPSSALDSGLAAKDALSSERAAAVATKNSLYDAIPKDVKMPVSNLVTKVDDIVNEIKDIPKVDRSPAIGAILKEYGNLKNISVGTAQVIRSNLGELATNGQGAERMYAARLLDALNNDMEALGKTSLLPVSQGPSLEAQDLRAAWGRNATETSGASADVVAPYVKPETFRPVVDASKLTNSDVVDNLKKANSFYKDFSDLYNHPTARALANAKPEEMANMVFRKGNVDDIRVAKSVLGDGFKGVQDQFYSQMLGKKDIGAALNKYSPEFLQEALTPSMKKALEAVDLMHRYAARVTLGAKAGAGAIGLGGAVELGRKLTH